MSSLNLPLASSLFNMEDIFRNLMGPSLLALLLIQMAEYASTTRSVDATFNVKQYKWEGGQQILISQLLMFS